jgi:hypothetical protein
MNALKPYLDLMNRWGEAVARAAKGVAVRRRARIDTRVWYETSGGRIKYAVQLRNHFRHENPHLAIQQLRDLKGPGEKALLFAPMTTESQREALQKGDVDYVDLAGNVHLERRGFLVHVEGKRGRPRAEPHIDRIFKRAGLQVVYVLLVRPDAVTWPYRRLAEAAGVALRTANYVVEGLRAEGFVGGRGKRRRLAKPRDLMARWVNDYGLELRPKLVTGTYRIRPRTRVRLLDDLRRYFERRELPWALTGAEAAFRLTHYYRGERIVIFAPIDLPGFEDETDCMHDQRGDLQILRYFCEMIETPKGKRKLPLAHPLLVYAELVADGTDRAVGAAELLRERLPGEFVNGY